MDTFFRDLYTQSPPEQSLLDSYGFTSGEEYGKFLDKLVDALPAAPNLNAEHIQRRAELISMWGFMRSLLVLSALNDREKAQNEVLSFISSLAKAAGLTTAIVETNKTTEAPDEDKGPKSIH